MARFTLLVATTNPDKTREIARILGDLPIDLVSLADLGTVPDEPEETGATFAGNARLKAHYYAAQSGWPTVAEDSGLAIDALGGRPGIHSARYPGARYPDKFANLYRELAPHPRPWTARYVCSVAFTDPVAPRTAPGAPAHVARAFACEATVEGEIAPEPAGNGGFGYDPIFFYPPYETTLGDVDDARKLAIAHRGQAFRAFKSWLEDTCLGVRS